MVRLNITMPEDLDQRLRRVKNKSRFIALAVREKFQKEEKAKLQALMIEGYKAMAAEDQDINQEWEETMLEDGLDL